MIGQLILIGGFAASVYVGLVFLVAGIDKLRHRQLLPGVVANYRLLPDALIQPVSLVLPFAELAVGVGLLVGDRSVMPWVAIAMLLVFAAAMAINIVRGRRHIDCGCGQAALRQELGWNMVVRNMGMAAALGLRLAAPADLGTFDLLLAVVAGGMLFLMTLMFNALKALPGREPGRARG